MFIRQNTLYRTIGFLIGFILISCNNPSQKRNQTESELLSLSKPFTCYPMDDFSLCIPSISYGQNIMVITVLSDQQLDAKLREWVGPALRNGARPLLLTRASDKEKAAAALMAQAAESGQKVFAIGSYFPAFVEASFNSASNFSGPNCYNTALIASGGMSPETRRIVTLDEFTTIVAEKYELVSEGAARFGDIVLYDAKFSKEHAALFLSRGLIFQKKGFKKGFGYRIKAIDAAYESEENEWAPSPLDDERYDNSPAVIHAPRAFYRLKAVEGSRSPSSLDGQEAKLVQLINFIEKNVVSEAQTWKLHSSLGVMMEGVVAELKKALLSLKTSPTYEARLAYGRLLSLNDQIYMSIDEALFSSPYARTREKTLFEANCYNEQAPFLRLFAAELAMVYRASPLSDAEYKILLEKLRSFDRKACRIPLVSLVKGL